MPYMNFYGAWDFVLDALVNMLTLALIFITHFATLAMNLKQAWIVTLAVFLMLVCMWAQIWLVDFVCSLLGWDK